jgi:hypothetical protein
LGHPVIASACLATARNYWNRPNGQNFR